MSSSAVENTPDGTVFAASPTYSAATGASMCRYPRSAGRPCSVDRTSDW